MSGMKISLDAAMRARDVSYSGWQDDNAPERPAGRGDGPVAAARMHAAAEPVPRPAEPAPAEPAPTEPAPAEPAQAGGAPAERAPVRVERPRRRRRTRLRHGRPA